MTFLVYAVAPGIFFKPMLDEFGWDRPTLSLVSSISMLVFAALSPFMGRMIDHFGPRIMLSVTAASQVFSCIFSGLAQGLAGVSIGRFLYELKPIHGTQIIVNHWFIKKRGRALGILSTAIPLGMLVLSPVSQTMVTSWGWRPTFFFWGGLTALLAVPLLLLARDKPEQKGLLPDGELVKNDSKISAEPSAETGVGPGEALKSRSVWLLFAAHLICGITCGLILTHIVIFATDLDYSAIIGASFLSVAGGASLLGVLVTGVMSDKMRRNRVLSLTHLIRSIAIFLLVVGILTGGRLWLLYAAMTLFGFGFFTTSPLVGGLVADLFGSRRMGTMLGIILSSHMIGMALGTYAGGFTYQLTGSYRDIFIIASALEFVACICVFLIRPVRHSAAPANFSSCD